jgi:hypothetical protein
MAPWRDRMRGGLQTVDEFIGRAREAMTPGERWTAALALLLVTAFVLFGLPADRVVVPGAAARPVPLVGAPVVPPGLAAPATLPPFGRLSGGVPGAADSLGGSEVVALAPPDVPPAVPRVVALVRTGTLSARDDTAAAALFLGKAGVTATPITDDPANAGGTCARAMAAGRLVVAAAALSIALRDCLLSGGATVVSFDDLGPVIDSDAGARSVSTRRGIGRALVDLANGAPIGVLRGRVGVVAGARVRRAVDGAIPGVTATGVNVVDVVSLADDASNADVGDAVRKFAGENIEVVVFALPVARQRQWLGLASVLLRAARYVVADAYDAVVSDESYSPTFDGALALTSVRGTWSARARGETPVQQSCRQQWEAATTPAKMLPGDETLDVYAWCEHATLVAQALQRMLVDGVDIGRALTLARLDAPLTSPLGPVDDGELGPTFDAVVVWRASCQCWMEQTAFAPR